MPVFRRGIATSVPDYDMRAWQAATGLQTLPPGQHYPDTYKLPNHMTFSNESMYSTPERQGGSWTQNPDNTYTFTPGPENLRQHTPQQLQDYFKRVEPGNFLNLPGYREGGFVTGGTDMATLRRGIAHYQTGDENVLPFQPPVATQRPLVTSQAPAVPVLAPAPAPVSVSASVPDFVPASAPAPAFETFRRLLGDAIGMRGQAARDAAFRGGQPSAPAVPVTPQAPLSNGGGFTDPMSGYSTPGPGVPVGGFGQLVSGQYPAAQQNPESSQATRALAGFADYINRNIRTQNLVNIAPSWLERTQNFFGGDRVSDAVLAERQKAAEALGHPLAQQHLINNPDHLVAAEKDPLGYVQSSAFKDIMQRTINANAEAAANDKVTPENHSNVVNDVIKVPGATVDQANAKYAPHLYTKEEFRKAMLGAPLQVVQMLFGQQLAHIEMPQEKAATRMFDMMHGDFVNAHNRVKEMEAEQAYNKAHNLPPPAHSRYVLYGKNDYDTQKDERDRLYNITMDALKAISGATEKPQAAVRPVKP